jgi:hypothetical protein
MPLAHKKAQFKQNEHASTLLPNQKVYGAGHGFLSQIFIFNKDSTTKPHNIATNSSRV